MTHTLTIARACLALTFCALFSSAVTAQPTPFDPRLQPGKPKTVQPFTPKTNQSVKAKTVQPFKPKTSQAVKPQSKTIASAQRQTQARQELQAFSIVLVEGSAQDGGSSDLPAAARAAIDDVKDFLPYRSYRVLDSAWILAPTKTVMSRVRGADRAYQIALTLGPGTDAGPLGITFVLSDPASPDSRGQGELSHAHSTLVQTYRTLEAKRAAAANDPAAAGTLEFLDRQVADARTRVAAAEADLARRITNTSSLIDTAFAMQLNETVVVGTSRVGGDKALIVLLTAVPRDRKP